MQLYLIRHPQPAVAPGICYGRADLPLAGPVAVEAAALRAALAEQRDDTALPAVVSSPLQRCRLLAEALSPAPRLEPRLQEMHFGAWEGRPWDTIPRAELDRWAAAPFDFCPPGGESPAAMAERVVAFAAELPAAAAGGDLLVVAHNGPLRVLAAHLLGLPRSAWFDFDFDFARFSCLDLAPEGNRLRWLNGRPCS